jgi:hypothetical protein
VVTVALNRGLAAYADGVDWVRATPDDWITTAALSFLGAGIILHVGIGLRWPFARPGPAVPAVTTWLRRSRCWPPRPGRAR